MITRKEIEEKIQGYPIFEYAFFPTKELNFFESVRSICKSECPQYGKSWSCPPGVGTSEECKARCRSYENAFIFSTVAEVNDILDMEEMLSTRKEHIEVVDQIKENIFGKEALILTAESCEICNECTHPHGPCKHPEKMYPCIESYTISVTEICENHQLSFFNGYNMVAWFCLVLY